MKATPDGARAYTANGPSNDVSVIDLATRRVVKRIPVGKVPQGHRFSCAPLGMGRATTKPPGENHSPGGSARVQGW